MKNRVSQRAVNVKFWGALAVLVTATMSFSSYTFAISEKKSVALEEYADLDDPISQTNLGVMYDLGRGVPQSDDAAIYWYKEAIKRGSVKAKYNLTRKLAQQGDVESQYELGEFYEKGRQVAKNNDIAIYWYEKASQQGHEKATQRLSKLYYELGRTNADIENNDATTIYWYNKAALLGNADAQFRLGRMFENGQGTDKNQKVAFYWYEQAAMNGNADAQTNLGYAYANGLGIRKDNSKSAMWYEQAAEQGNVVAQFNLAWMYEEGVGVPKDQKIAYDLYHLAAEQGDANAQNNIGLMLESGIGVEKDKEMAIFWYQQAADQGNEKAIFNLNRIGVNR